MSNSVEVLQIGQIARDSSATVKRINNLLNSSKTRLEGLQLLNLFLQQCPDEDFLSFCVSWMQNCCKVENLRNNRNCAAPLLSHLLKTSSKYPELKKSVSFFITTRYFDFFFKYLLNSEAGWTCTKTCLLLYRGACGPFQESLEKHLTKEIKRDVIVSSVIGECLSLLPCTGGGGNDGMNYKRNWKNQFVKFIDICNSILNDLYADVEDVQSQDTPAPEHNKKKRGRKIEDLAVRLQNHCNVLGCMLLNQYPAPKNIPSDLVFQLICRGLAVNPKTAGKLPMTDAAPLQKALPDIHYSFLRLLQAVIITCKNQLLPYSRLIGKLIKQSLQWTESDFTYENGKSFARLRTATYETLCDWVTVARSGSCIELVSDAVVSTAVNDARPSTTGVVFLKEYKQQNIEQTPRQIDGNADGVICRAALRALQFLLKFTGVLISPEVHKFLQEAVVKLLVEVQRNPVSDVAPPFDDPACRSELYSLLLELVYQPCPKWPPPTNFALRLFSRGVNDVSTQVSSFCSAALNFTTIIIHPQYDNGGFQLHSPLEGRTRPEEAPMELDTEEALLSLSPVQDETVQKETIGNGENLKESNETDAPVKRNDTNDVSEMSSGEDSRNTVTFSKDFEEAGKEQLAENEEKAERRKGESIAEEDPEPKRRRTSTENSVREKTPSPTEETTHDELRRNDSPSILPESPESGKMKKQPEGNPTRDSSGPESVSPEPTNEDSHPKGRYFLRSQTKGSSEEPEETSRRASSPDSSKMQGTPGRNLAKTPSTPRNRRRTRALSKVEGTIETEDTTAEKNVQDEEEDIRAAFDDSFVD